MSVLNRNHKWLVCFALAFSGFSYWAGFKLLNQGLLTGSEFVTLLIAATVVSLVIVFAPFIQEVSIAGNVIKLKEAKLEADESLKELTNVRVSILVATLTTLRRAPLSTGEQLEMSDDRIAQFLSLYKANKDLQANPQVKNALIAGANYFLQECQSNFSRQNIHTETLGYRPEPEALELWIRQNKKLENEQDYPHIVKEYRCLFELLDNLKRI